MQTVVILDWDDTLFPTNWVDVQRGRCYLLPKSGQQEQQFEEPIPEGIHEAAIWAAALIEVLAKLADKVVIVTLAARPWVQNCIGRCYELLGPLLERLDIDVEYAREYQQEDDPFDAQELYLQLKQRAIAHQCDVVSALENTVLSPGHPGGKSILGVNVLSIGDSHFEQRGTQRFTAEWMRRHHRSAELLPRTKTVKMMDRPTADELAWQLGVIAQWVEAIIRHDGAFNFDFEKNGKGIRNVDSLIQESFKDVCPQEDVALALFMARFWKPKSDEDPRFEWHWIPRRMWLSRTGHLWYESLKEGRAQMHLSGVPVGQLIVEATRPDEVVLMLRGTPVYGLAFRRPDGGRQHFLAMESAEERDRFLQVRASVRPLPVAGSA